MSPISFINRSLYTLSNVWNAGTVAAGKLFHRMVSFSKNVAPQSPAAKIVALAAGVIGTSSLAHYIMNQIDKRIQNEGDSDEKKSFKTVLLTSLVGLSAFATTRVLSQMMQLAISNKQYALITAAVVAVRIFYNYQPQQDDAASDESSASTRLSLASSASSRQEEVVSVPKKKEAAAADAGKADKASKKKKTPPPSLSVQAPVAAASSEAVAEKAE